jgi:hypothetical protein
MKKTLVLSLCLLLAASFALARTDKGAAPVQFHMDVQGPVSDQFMNPQFKVGAQADTTFLCWFTFDSGPNCVNEGWITVDRTAQTHVFWHVDTFVGLGGGLSGFLAPLEGAKSMWCGTRGAPVPDLILCGYATVPGYGNGWNQSFCSPAVQTADTNDVTLSFQAYWDSEPGYDATTIDVDLGNDNADWVDWYGGSGVYDTPPAAPTTESIVIPDTLHLGATFKIRWQFQSDGAWSDQDGLWNTDGGILIDAVSLSADGAYLAGPEYFEAADSGATGANGWVVCNEAGYGDFAAMYPGLYVVQEDPCYSDLTCLWTFYTGSTYDYGCGGWPAQTAVPYENARGQYIWNEIWSPAIPKAGSGTKYEIRFNVYRDQALKALIFYIWHVRNIKSDLCPSRWRDDNFVYYGNQKDWLRRPFPCGTYVSANDILYPNIGIAVGTEDMCAVWKGTSGDCLCHSHAPLIDEIEIYRITSEGPQYVVRDIDFFQDNFSADGTITGTARADGALDILLDDNPAILPADSAVIKVSESLNGLAIEYGDPAVYCFVDVQGPNGAVTDAGLLDNSRYEYIGTESCGGRTWAKIQMDSTWTAAGSPVSETYNIDLNDNLFVPGDTIFYYFGAKNTLGVWNYFSLSTPTANGDTQDKDMACTYPQEFTILPAGGYNRGGDILYVDGMQYRGAQPYWDSAFDFLNIRDLVDRYDINGPSSSVGNHPGSRVTAVDAQLVAVYKKILWDCGDLAVAFGDGLATSDKSDDAGMVASFLGQLPTTGGFYLAGDDVAQIMSAWTSPSAIALLAYNDYTLQAASQVSLVGIAPYVVGTAGGIFSDVLGPDTLVAYGGCFGINDFDVITPNGAGVIQAATYQGAGATAGAIVADTTLNGVGGVASFVLSGFAFHFIRDPYPASIPARAEHMWRILTYLENIFDEPTGVTPVLVTSLDQNYPNPFNPTTTIKYTLADRGQVSLRVYNVAGQLVRTLVNDVQTPDAVRPVTWNGLNDSGQPVASGVYFYKLVTNDFSLTKKLVLLK